MALQTMHLIFKSGNAYKETSLWYKVIKKELTFTFLHYCNHEKVKPVIKQNVLVTGMVQSRLVL